MMSRIFIEKPRLAVVISILLIIAGLICINIIPVSQYPEIVPPQVRVTATYPGADSSTVEQIIAQQIEEAVNGVDNMLYMSSTSSDDGRYSLSVTFALGSNPDMNVVNVQNKIKTVESKLPEEVVKQGIEVKKASSSMLMVITFNSPNKTFDQLYLSNYVKMNVYDEVYRIHGVGDLNLYGYEYSMRIWLDSDKVKQLGISTKEISAALQSQNIQSATGLIGGRPTNGKQLIQLSITSHGRLLSADEFEKVVVRTNADGSHLYLGDIAKIELGAKNMTTEATYNGNPSATLIVYQAAGSNAVETVDNVMKTLNRLETRFPKDLKYEIAFDSTQFIRISIEEVIKTLFEALVLVILAIYLFLGKWRTTLIPLLAIPVSLIGTFAFMYACGFTANTVSLLALVLAISIVVDDAIVVVENVERVMEEENLSPKKATIKAMEEITAPVIAITLVLLSVFVPVAFVGGITGKIYREFAMTISISMLISAVNALTLSPAMCALLLKPANKDEERTGLIGGILNFIDRTKDGYANIVAKLVYKARLSILVVILFAIGAGFLFKIVPTGFLPSEDQGMILLQGFLPNGSSLDQTSKLSAEVAKSLKGVKGVRGYQIISGYSFIDGVSESNSFMSFIPLDGFDERKSKDLSIGAISGDIMKHLSHIKNGLIIPFQLPPIIGLGNTGGFEYQLQDLYGGELSDLYNVGQSLTAEANKAEELSHVFSTFDVSSPVLELDLDREKATALGLNISDIFSTMQTVLGGSYVNDFSLYGRSWQVNVQGDYNQRKDVSAVENINIKNSYGKMVPLESVADLKLKAASKYISRYNNYRSIKINGGQKIGFSSGQGLEAMERISKKVLPAGYSYEWTGTSAQEKEASGATTKIFAMAILFAYLFLTALYESWTIPLGVLLSVVVGIFGSMFFIYLNDMENGMYVQIGLITLIALASKNAILIAEFAKDLRETGQEVEEAAYNSAKIRFRPIMMTAVAAIAGFMPLVLSSGAGAISRFDIGVTLIGGLLFASSIGLFLIPMLYIVFQNHREDFHKKRKAKI